MAKRAIKKKIATNLPKQLLSEATKLSGLNQTAAIVAGLAELIKREKLKRLVALEGKVQLQYDVNRLRNRARF